MPTTPLLTPKLAPPRAPRRQQLLYTREDLRQLLNEDLRRERKTHFALASLASRGYSPDVSAKLERHGRLVARHQIVLERVLLDMGGRVDADVDELNAILGADRVMDPAWRTESIRRLHERARQLRTAGFSGLAKRMMKIVNEKQKDV